MAVVDIVRPPCECGHEHWRHASLVGGCTHGWHKGQGCACAVYRPQAPRQVSCGCCTGGCVCAVHQDAPGGRPARACVYHGLHGHTRETETQEQANERRARVGA